MLVKLPSSTPKESDPKSPETEDGGPADPSGPSYEYQWAVNCFKDWHEDKPKKSVSSPMLLTSGVKKSRQCKLRMKLVSEGMAPENGRVHLKLFVEYHSRKFWKFVPIDVKISVIDESGVKRHTQEFILPVIGIPRSVYIARYFYRTRKDDLSKDLNHPFYLIIDNTATFHLEAKLMSTKELNLRLDEEKLKEEYVKTEAKLKAIRIQREKKEAKQAKDALEGKEPKKTGRLVGKVWDALCNWANIPVLGA